MNKEQIKETVCKIISESSQFGGDNIQLDKDLRDTYGIDSISLVDVLIDIECELDISIDSNLLTYDNFSTVQAILDYIYKISA